ncbi:MAG TPA: TIGR02444 family protein [Alphaproteobacteria bacterium]|nr:TIGR02444 family protein [Alphaproteobacteria bacterium]
MMTGLPHHPFWDFSLRVYGQPGVAPACLELQDRHGLDVNLLLLCCWLGHCQKAPPTRGDVVRLAQTVTAWHNDVVRPLRHARRRLKAPGPTIAPPLAEALREQVKRIELDAEHVEQLTLAAALPQAETLKTPLPGHAVAALGFYLDSVGVSPDETDRQNLTALLRAAFPDTPAERIGALAGGLYGPA